MPSRRRRGGLQEEEEGDTVAALSPHSMRMMLSEEEGKKRNNRKMLKLPPAVDDEEEDFMKQEQPPSTTVGTTEAKGKTTKKNKKKDSDNMEASSSSTLPSPTTHRQRATRTRYLRPEDESCDGSDDDEDDSYDVPGAVNVPGRMGSVAEDGTVQVGTVDDDDNFEDEGNNESTTSNDDIDDEQLVVAELAPEPLEIVEGKPVSTWKIWLTIIFLMLIIVGGVVLPAVLLTAEIVVTQEPTMSPAPTTGPSMAPTSSISPTMSPSRSPSLSPSESPTTFRSVVVKMLSEYIPGGVLPATPIQEVALEWLVQNDDGLVDAKDSNRLLERFSLAVLYHAMNGDDDWKENLLWLSDESVCGWGVSHVTCDDLGRVTELNLRGNGLSGGIPTEIGLLTLLTLFYVNGNKISGPIPSEIGLLTRLTILWLQGNQLSGSIPTSVGELTAMESLSLYENNLHGIIPSEIGALTSLRFLSLHTNRLSGTIPSSVGHLTGLTIFPLQINNLNGTIPSELGLLTSLTSLELTNNNLTGSIPSEVSNLLQSLGNCHLEGNPGLTGIPGNCCFTCAASTTTSLDPTEFCPGNFEGDTGFTAVPGENCCISCPASSPAPSAFCPETNRFQLNLTLDVNGRETSWDIQDQQGVIVYWSPVDNYPNGQPGHNILEGDCLGDGAYTFTLYDSFGDGVYEPGSYELIVGGIQVLSGGADDFNGYEISTSFTVPVDTVSATASPAPSAICPETNRFQLNLTLDASGEETSWDLQRQQGGFVYASPKDGYAGGQENFGTNIIETGCLEDGSYTFTFYDSNGDGLCLNEDYHYLYDYVDDIEAGDLCGSYELMIGGVLVATSDGLGNFFVVPTTFDVPFADDTEILD